MFLKSAFKNLKRNSFFTAYFYSWRWDVSRTLVTNLFFIKIELRIPEYSSTRPFALLPVHTDLDWFRGHPLIRVPEEWIMWNPLDTDICGIIYNTGIHLNASIRYMLQIIFVHNFNFKDLCFRIIYSDSYFVCS